MKLNVAIVEDSQENIDILKYFLEKSNYQIELLGIAKTTTEAKLLLTRPDIDLAFLDIQLKEGTIFDVLKELTEKQRQNFEMVFVTAHGSYENALKAIQFACLDFVNKPIDKNELGKSIAKAVEKKKETGNRPEQIQYLLELISNNAAPHSIGIVLSKGVIEFVPIDQIQHVQADQSISRVYLENGKKYNSAKPLGYYLQLLADNDQFTQSGKSDLINLSMVKQYNHRERSITFKNGQTLIASHRYSVELRKNLMDAQSKPGKKGWSMFKKLLE